ncbi:hypothetical protein ACFL0T_08735 [Candidatus Omnitrophota bacterium]
MLFMSWYLKVSQGQSLKFVFAPDSILFKPIKAYMSGYDFLDLWFINIIKAQPGTYGMVKITVLLLGVVFTLSFIVFVLNFMKVLKES